MTYAGLAPLVAAGVVAGWHGEAVVRGGERPWGWRILAASALSAAGIGALASSVLYMLG